MLELGLDDLKALPDAPAPAGLEVRPVAREHYRAVWEAIGETDAAWAYVEVPDEDDFRRFVRDAEPTFWRVAWDGDEVAGAALCRLVKGRGEVEELSVRVPWRRRGLGRFLLVSGLRTLRESGVGSARLRTGAANPYRAWALYESVGFRRLKEYVRYRKPMDAENTAL